MMTQTVTFMANDRTQTVTIDIEPDLNIEGPEDMLVFLLNPTDTGGGTVFLGDLTYGVVTIYDEDAIRKFIAYSGSK